MPTCGDALPRYKSHTYWFIFVLTVTYEIFNVFSEIESEVLKGTQPLTQLEKNSGPKIMKTMI